MSLRVQKLFFDMNSFFASVAQQEEPALIGQPVGILTTDAPGAACIAASIEAKRATPGRDLFSQLCHLKDEDGRQFSDEEIGNHVMFVLFAGWYSGDSVELSQYPLMISAGVASLFANVNVAVPFMLDVMKIPSDTFQLFIATSVINSRFGTLLSAMFTLTLTLLGAFSMSGLIRINAKRVIRYTLITALLLLTTAASVSAESLTLVQGKNGMVSSQETIATEVGLKIMQQGGNAIDAAVATGFALAVTCPRAGNLAGGGFMLVYLADGRMYPVNYLRENNLVFMGIDGLWWREFVDQGQPIAMHIKGEDFNGHAKTVLDDPKYKADVFSRLRPTVPRWLPDWLNAKLVVITVAD